MGENTRFTIAAAAAFVVGLAGTVVVVTTWGNSTSNAVPFTFLGTGVVGGFVALIGVAARNVAASLLAGAVGVAPGILLLGMPHYQAALLLFLLLVFEAIYLVGFVSIAVPVALLGHRPDDRQA